MAELTLEQQRAIAMANARMRMGQAQAVQNPVPNTAAKGDREMQSPSLYDTAASAVSGLGKGALGLAGTIGDVQSLADSGAGWVAKQLGADPQTTDRMIAMSQQTGGRAPTSQQLIGGAEKAGVQFHRPNSTLGQYAETIGEFAPAVALGPGGLARKTAMAVIPGAASEYAGQNAPEGYETAARVGGALVGGVAAASKLPSSAMRQVQKEAPTLDTLMTARDDAYDALRNAGIKYDANEYQKSVTGLMTKLHGSGLRQYASPGPVGILKEMTTHQSPNWDDLESIRKVAGTMARAGKPDEQMWAKEIVKSIDDFQQRSPFVVTGGNISPQQAAPLMKEARELASRVIRQRYITEATDLAHSRVSGTDTALRHEFSKLMRPSRAKRFTPAERESIQDVAKGTVPRNMAYMAGKAGLDFGPLSGKAVAIPALMSLGMYSATDPIKTAAALAGASISKFGARKATEAAANRVGATVRAGQAAQGTASARDAAAIEAMQKRGLLGALNATIPFREDQR